MLIDLHDSDVSLHQIVQAIVTVLAVINPVVCGSILLTLTPRLCQNNDGGHAMFMRVFGPLI